MPLRAPARSPLRQSLQLVGACHLTHSFVITLTHTKPRWRLFTHDAFAALTSSRSSGVASGADSLVQIIDFGAVVNLKAGDDVKCSARPSDEPASASATSPTIIDTSDAVAVEDRTFSRKTAQPKMWKCQNCSYSTRHGPKTLAEHHGRIHTYDLPHACVQCDFRTRAASNLLKHVKRMHEKVRSFPREKCHSSLVLTVSLLV